ncbi:MAG: hypothetical protein A2Y78_06720 [Acidobacteria bacterium RBG_13_68_16]|nr:MAG: hypothetical protein A2Y78_06720 [Acidobacteria bacterium RBG_13_68_16]
MTTKIVIFYTTAEAVFVAQGARHLIVECSEDKVLECLDDMHGYVLDQGQIFLGASCHADTRATKSFAYVPYYPKEGGRKFMRAEEATGHTLNAKARSLLPDTVLWSGPLKGNSR